MDWCHDALCGSVPRDRGETSPVKIFDYLACGRPVIASAIPSVSATFLQEAGVALVPPDDPAALAQSGAGTLERSGPAGPHGIHWTALC